MKEYKAIFEKQSRMVCKYLFSDTYVLFSTPTNNICGTNRSQKQLNSGRG
jgi:hypothetical protein